MELGRSVVEWAVKEERTQVNSFCSSSDGTRENGNCNIPGGMAQSGQSCNQFCMNTVSSLLEKGGSQTDGEDDSQGVPGHEENSLVMASFA